MNSCIPSDNGSRFGRLHASLVVAGLMLVSVLGFGGLPAAAAPQELSGNEAITYLLFQEVLSGGDVELAGKLFSDSAVIHSPDGEYAGTEGVGQFLTALRTPFPDAVFTIESMEAEGDMITVVWTMSGTHMGAYRGLPATGADIRLRGLEVLRFDNYLIVEQWSHFNRGNVLNQIELAISEQVAIDDGRESADVPYYMEHGGGTLPVAADGSAGIPYYMEHGGGPLPVAGGNDGSAEIPYYMEHGGPLPVAGEQQSPIPHPEICPDCRVPA
jgi:steroid delta-isomerase-like uncharacterized protein